MRFELAADSINKEETIVSFDNAAKNQFVVNEDSEHMPGSGMVSLSSMSADSVTLAINKIPYPKQSTRVKLNVNAIADGAYKINMTEMQAIPKLFNVWLMDAYNKDSLDIKHNPTYSFNILMSDTNSYGANRFSLVIRQDPALGVHLLAFSAAKVPSGAQINWKTENEENYTNFTVERSTDNGATFTALGGFVSSFAGVYSFTDKDPLPLGKTASSNQYRLRLQDLVGNISYSNVVTLIYGNAGTVAANSISVYPNPAIGVINLAINQNGGASGNLTVQSTGSNSSTPANTYGIRILNITGSVIKTATSAQVTWQDDVSGLAPGTYIIQVHNNTNNSEVGNSTFVKL
jgi:hypothetical protein